MLLFGLFILLALEVANCQQKSEDGYVHINNRKKLKLYEPPVDIQNLNYPSEAPAALIQSWTITCHYWLKLRFTCPLIRIPENSPCEKYYVEVKDGDKMKRYCGEVKDLLILSSSSQLEVTFKTGKLYGGGLMNCNVEGFNPEFTTLAPPTTTKSYLDIDSVEVDSSEYGLKPGAKNTTCPCGWSNKDGRRIVGGKEAIPHEFPFMAALVSQEVGIPFCGATILTGYHAITAAHCTIKLIEYKIEGAILVGEHDYTKDNDIVDLHGISRIIQHENYDVSSQQNDIALVVLHREIKFNRFVGRACLPTRRLNLDHQYVKLLGWGRTDFKAETSKVLRKVDLRVVPMRDCLDIWSLFIPKDNPKHLCTYAKQKATCKGDSGGPAIWLDPETNRYTLVGLTSFGLNCSPNIPSVKTEVAAFLDWIHHHIQASIPEYAEGIVETCHKME
uniref:Venom s1 protease with cub domain 8 n=1 Tax=Pristhesancus plagipennis TaxID=1955184 RepID=A0A1Q1NPK8_PRIPG|nr:venom s1 protease with cub domain 8 [Pristhesancus plagipennis]